MDTYQVKFKILGGKGIYGGICVEDIDRKYVICGCCGFIFPINEIEIIKRYADWVNLSEEIKGDE